MGHLDVQAGYYVYVGSAFGPGGVRARLLRHFRTAKKRHWHIDYLRNITEPLSAWCSYRADRLEHHWAQAFLALPNVECITGFGSSDCRCQGHLFYTSMQPRQAGFADVIEEPIEVRLV